MAGVLRWILKIVLHMESSDKCDISADLLEAPSALVWMVFALIGAFGSSKLDSDNSTSEDNTGCFAGA